MRLKEREVTDKKEIEKILMESDICRLAMVDGDKPYIVPMNFGYQDGSVFFHCAKEGRKLDVIRKNSNICFEVDQAIKFIKAKSACDWGIKYKSVIGFGQALLVDDPDEKRKGLDIIMSHYSGKTFEYSDEMIEKIIVIKVIVDHMTGKQS